MHLLILDIACLSHLRRRSTISLTNKESDPGIQRTLTAMPGMTEIYNTNTPPLTYTAFPKGGKGANGAYGLSTAHSPTTLIPTPSFILREFFLPEAGKRASMQERTH